MRRPGWSRYIPVLRLLILAAGLVALVLLLPGPEQSSRNSFGWNMLRAPAPAGQMAPSPATQHGGNERITCSRVSVIDGDTIDCGGTRIRLAGIDAPEMPGHCQAGRECTPGDPHASRAHLQHLAQGTVTCRRTDTDHYGRIVALCESAGRDLSCAMVSDGHAVRRYGNLRC